MLHDAALKGRGNMATLLLEKGASVHTTDCVSRVCPQCREETKCVKFHKDDKEIFSEAHSPLLLLLFDA